MNQLPTDNDAQALWRSIGGDFHGPQVEHGMITEEKLLPFLKQVLLVRSILGFYIQGRTIEDVIQSEEKRRYAIEKGSITGNPFFTGKPAFYLDMAHLFDENT